MQLGIPNKDLFDRDLFSKKIFFELIVWYVTYAVLHFISCCVGIYFHLCFYFCCFVAVVVHFLAKLFLLKKIKFSSDKKLESLEKKTL